MKLLFDQGTPKPLRRALSSHQISTAFLEGWSHLKNGDLLAAAEAAAFDAIITTDQNLRYQQNLAGRRLAIVVLMTTRWPWIEHRVDRVAEAVNTLKSGDYVELEFSAAEDSDDGL